jgi:HSP20 family protein
MEDLIMIPMLRTRGTSMPSLVDFFFGDDFLPSLHDKTNTGTVPAVNIVESKDDYLIELAAPGFEKKDFKVDIDNNMLTISSEKELKNEVEGEKLMRREFCYTSFKRSFSLPEGTDGDKIKATYKEGILKITVPKREEAKEKPARQISIS